MMNDYDMRELTRPTKAKNIVEVLEADLAEMLDALRILDRFALTIPRTLLQAIQNTSALIATYRKNEEEERAS